MIKKLGFILGFIVLVAMSVLSGGVLLIVAFPFMVLCLQKLGVIPK